MQLLQTIYNIFVTTWLDLLPWWTEPVQAKIIFMLTLYSAFTFSYDLSFHLWQTSWEGLHRS